MPIRPESDRKPYSSMLKKLMTLKMPAVQNEMEIFRIDMETPEIP